MSKSKLGVSLFILSEANFFALLIVAYIFFHAYPGEGPTAATALNVGRTTIFSILLFASSGTAMLAARGYRAGNRSALLRWLVVTIALGAVFLIGQAREYVGLYESGVVLNRNLFATTFFTLTGFHGLHVFIGLCALTIVAGLTAAGNMGAAGPQGEAFESVELYWHFVDAVWVVVFSVVYLWTLF
ncbi:MAG TPA: heme-copper oxidase subunit III [Candidatus Binataceae bacterium]|nr:heme-copper oxidase subunit III [Candidatus Binataceae bacterium]